MLAYIAGFFDGEGYVTISKASNRSKSGSRYWLIASFTNTHKGVLDEIQKVVGGKVIFHQGNKGLTHHYRLTFYSRQANDLMKKITPYLIVKKPEAEIAIKYQNGIRQVGSGRGLTESELAFQDQCYQEIRSYHGNKMKKS